MKQFQELTIHPLSSASEIINLITQHLSPNWSRAYDQEKRMNELSFVRQYGFKYKDVSLWIVENYQDLTVSNIVPNYSGQLSIDDYNDILNSFVNENLVNLSTLVQYRLTKPEITLYDVVHRDIAVKFEVFCRSSNKSTGYSHPSDERKWFDLLLTMVDKNEYLGFDFCRSFLLEYGWTEEWAYRLAVDMEYGCSAMRFALGKYQ